MNEPKIESNESFQTRMAYIKSKCGLTKTKKITAVIGSLVGILGTIIATTIALIQFKEKSEIQPTPRPYYENPQGQFNTTTGGWKY